VLCIVARASACSARLQPASGAIQQGRPFLSLNPTDNGHPCASLIGMKLKQTILALSIAAGLLSVGAVQAQEKDYSKTKQYQQGVREGKDDHDHNKDHSKKRHFNKDEDQKAYEAGYQKGFVVQVKIP
jgi:hypothetical protein